MILLNPSISERLNLLTLETFDLTWKDADGCSTVYDLPPNPVADHPRGRQDSKAVWLFARPPPVALRPPPL